MLRIFLALLLAGIHAGWATSFSKPQRHDVFSPNGEFVLDVDPATETHTIYKTADRSAPLWSFKKRVWHYPFFLSNDGAVVATAAWEFVQADRLDAAPCVEFRNRNGIFKVHTFADLCSAPLRTDLAGGGPIGDFWRTWYWEANQDGNRIHIRTTDLWQHTFDLTSGEIVRRRVVAYNLLFKPWFYIGLALCGSAVVIWIMRLRNSRPSRSAAGKHA